ncbi:hypothetical protein [Salipiger sp.]|uniref:hypothetical protein n=1 Tax=Salipiger sp. TaxID=2078585 RepID=UPI003A96A820
MNVAVAPERHAQLVELRDHFGYASLSETIRDLIAAFRDVHRLPHTIPGIDLHRAANGLVLTIGDERLGLSFDRARARAIAIATAIRDFIAEDRAPRRSEVYVSGPEAHDFAVTGRGPAVILRIGSVERRFRPDVAAALADLLTRAAS